VTELTHALFQDGIVIHLGYLVSAAKRRLMFAIARARCFCDRLVFSKWSRTQTSIH
jgi:hypothetical protein